MSLHLMSVIGARPQFVKAAMVVEAVRAYNQNGQGPELRHTLIHTGQHYDPNMSDIFFRQLPLPEPQCNLGVGSGTHGKQTSQVLEGFEQVLISERPDVVIVYGDTNSTLAGALAAVKMHTAVAHVEAGLRSFNRTMPEEINRVVTDHVSDVLFCPTDTAVTNLRNEGITQGIYRNGDVMLDAVLAFKPVADSESRILGELDLVAGQYVLFTMHRAENTESSLQIASALDVLLQLQWPVVFPIHPRTRNRIQSLPELRKSAYQLNSAQHVRLIDPVSYLDMLALESNARAILTDSGGVQKEAYFLGVPCLTVRTETEWTETLEGGWNRLVDCSADAVMPILESLWSSNGMKPKGLPNTLAFGGGYAAKIVVEQLAQRFSQR